MPRIRIYVLHGFAGCGPGGISFSHKETTKNLMTIPVRWPRLHFGISRTLPRLWSRHIGKVPTMLWGRRIRLRCHDLRIFERKRSTNGIQTPGGSFEEEVKSSPSAHILRSIQGRSQESGTQSGLLENPWHPDRKWNRGNVFSVLAWNVGTP